jgi:hypothetical protein
LVAATVALCAALFAAYVTYRNTTATLALNTQQETQRRCRKHAAVRSVLPLALVKVTEYAEVSAHGLCDLLKRFGTRQHDAEQGTIPHGSIPQDLAWISEGANKSWCSRTGAKPVRVRP